MLAASNYLFTWGIHISAKRTITTLLNHATLPVSYLISIFAFGENPSWLTAVGSLLTLGSVTTLLTQ
jgi:drug/metabolite transporter (DMT)-like permease